MGHGGKGSAPQQEAQIRGQQISAGSWLQRLKSTSQRATAQQPVSKRDLMIVQHQLHQEIEKTRSGRVTAGTMAGRGAKMMARGFKDISRSLNTPDAPRNRMAIAQLPQPSKSPMRQGFDLSRLKDPALRSRNLMNKRVK